MSQAPKRLTPELSARHRFGAELRAWRIERGLSQAGLAKLIHVHPDLIAKIEKAVRWPTRELAASCDVVLEASGRLVDLYAPVVLERQAVKDALAGSTTAGKCGGYPASDLDAQALLVLSDAVGASPGVERESVASLLDAVTFLARDYGERRPLDTFTLAARYREVVCRQAGRTPRVSDLRDLHVLATITSGLMASAAFDLARIPAAATLAKAAAAYADLSCHPSAIGWVHGLTATLLNWQRRPLDGLAEVERGLAAAPGPAAMQRLMSIAARSYAQLERGDAVRESLLAADRCADRRDGTDLVHDQIGGEFAFDEPRAQACAGAAWLRLGDLAAAEVRLRSAVNAYAAQSGATRQLVPWTGARIDLASVCLLRRDLDAAGAVAAEALPAVGKLRISVVDSRVRDLGTHLRSDRWSSVRDARVLAEQVSASLVTADAQIS